MTSYLVEIYGESKGVEDSFDVVRRWPNSYTVRVDLTADNPDEEIDYQLWQGFFKNKRWFRVYELDEKGDVCAMLNLLSDKFEKVAK